MEQFGWEEKFIVTLSRPGQFCLKGKVLCIPYLEDELRRNRDLALIGSNPNSFPKFFRELNHCDS